MTNPKGAPDDAPTPRRLAGVSALTALFAAEILAISALKLPQGLRFKYVAFEDLGGNLIVWRALGEGLRPAVDFYYPYGLLPLLVCRAWFDVFGGTPGASFAMGVACNLLIAWALARLVVALRVPATGVALLVACLPQCIRYSYLNLTHGLEAVLLCHALASHAAGKRGAALALVTACAFVKPTMAYVYGFLLLVLILRDLIRRRALSRPELFAALGPACLVGVALAALVVAGFGVRPALAAQFPVRGGLHYKLLNYGFFRGTGRAFLRPSGAGPGYYAGTIAGFWAVATLTLLAGGIASAWRLARGGGGVRDEVVATCAALHAAFVCLFYGHSWDWINYVSILLIGLLAMIGRGRVWTIAAAFLTLVALVGLRSSARDTASSWTMTARSPTTAGLWAEADEREEWGRVLALTEGREPLLLKLSGCGEMLFPGFRGTSTWYLEPRLIGPLAPAAEIDRVVSRIEAARAVVVAHDGTPDLAEYPRFHAALAGSRRVMRGRFFDVYSRGGGDRRDLPRPDGAGNRRPGRDSGG